MYKMSGSLKSHSDKKLYRSIYRLFNLAGTSIRLSYFVCVLLISLGSALDGITVHVSLRILTDIANNTISTEIKKNIVLFGLLVLAATFVRFSTQLLNSITSARLGLTINLNLFKALESREEYGNTADGDYISAMTTQISIVVAKVFAPIINLFSSVGAVFAISIVIFSTNPRVAAPSCLILLGAYAAYSQIVKARLNINSKKITRGFSEQASLISETIKMKDYRLLSIDKIDRTSNFQKFDKNVKNSDAYNRIIGSLPRNIFEFIFAIIIIFMGWSPATKDMSPVDILGFIGMLTLILQRLLPQLQQIFNCLNSIRSGSASVYEISNILFNKIQPTGQKEDKYTKDSIHNAFFTNKKNIFLSLVNREDRSKIYHLNVSLGGITVIAGKSGCGKTTIAKSLCGLASEYDIYLKSNLENIKLPPNQLRKLVYFESQSPELINAPLIENIILGNIANNYSNLESTFKLLDIKDIGDRNITNRSISGGQLKRIAFARCNFHLRPIIILDEPTSGLDHNNEEIILQQIHELSKRSFLIVITHSSLLKNKALTTLHIK